MSDYIKSLPISEQVRLKYSRPTMCVCGQWPEIERLGNEYRVRCICGKKESAFTRYAAVMIWNREVNRELYPDF